MVMAVAAASPAVPVISPGTPRHFSQAQLAPTTNRWPGTPTSIARLATSRNRPPGCAWRPRTQALVAQSSQVSDAAHASTSRLSLNGLPHSLPFAGFAAAAEELSAIGALVDSEVATPGCSTTTAEANSLARHLSAVTVNSAAVSSTSNAIPAGCSLRIDVADATPKRRLLSPTRRLYQEPQRRSRTLSPLPRRNAGGEVVESIPAALPVRRRSVVEWADSMSPPATMALSMRSPKRERAESLTPSVARNSRGMTSRRIERIETERDRVRKVDVRAVSREKIPQVKRRHRPHRLLCYGDSLTAGFCSGGKHFEPYGLILGELLSASGLPCEVTICGLNGLTAQELVQGARSQQVRDISKKVGRGLIRILEDDAPQDLVILMAGTNDLGCKVNAEAVFENVRYLHESCHALGVPTVALVPPAPLFPRFRIERSRLAATMAEWVQTTPGVVAIADCEALVPRAGWAALDDTLLSGKAATVEVNEKNFWDPDVIHMSPEGSNMLARRLLTLVSPILQRSDMENDLLITPSTHLRSASAIKSPVQRDQRRPGKLDAQEAQRSSMSSTAPPSPLPVSRGPPSPVICRSSARSPSSPHGAARAQAKATSARSPARFPCSADAAPCPVPLGSSPSEANAPRASAAAPTAPTPCLVASSHADLIKKSVPCIVTSNRITSPSTHISQDSTPEDLASNSKLSTTRSRPASMAIPVSSSPTASGTVLAPSQASAATAPSAAALAVASVLTAAAADAAASCLPREAQMLRPASPTAAATARMAKGLAGGLNSSIAAPTSGQMTTGLQRGKEALNSAPQISVQRRPHRARSSSSGVRTRISTHAPERSIIEV